MKNRDANQTVCLTYIDLPAYFPGPGPVYVYTTMQVDLLEEGLRIDVVDVFGKTVNQSQWVCPEYTLMTEYVIKEVYLIHIRHKGEDSTAKL